MKVSALITTYNYAHFVAAAVESVLAQDYGGELECVVVDDGSTDDTDAVLAPYRERIRYLRRDNGGQAAALNTAFEHSGGDLICLLDADDTWKPHKVRRVVEEFASRPQVGLVHHALDIVDPEGRTIEQFQTNFRPARGDVAHTMIRKVLPYPFTFSSGVSLRRRVCEYIFPLYENQKSNADGLIATSAAWLAPVAYVEESLGRYLVHGRNIWAVDFMARKQGSFPMEEWIPRHNSDLEEKVRQANRTLTRDGRPAGLSPWMSWSYLKYSAMQGVGSPLTLYPRALRAVLAAPGLGPAERCAVALGLLRRAWKHRRLAPVDRAS